MFPYHSKSVSFSSCFFSLDRCSIPSREVSILWSYLDITLLFSSYVYLIFFFLILNKPNCTQIITEISTDAFFFLSFISWIWNILIITIRFVLLLREFSSVRILSHHTIIFTATVIILFFILFPHWFSGNIYYLKDYCIINNY
jgi:hypothetical protein